MRPLDWVMLSVGSLGFGFFLGTLGFQSWHAWKIRRAIRVDWNEFLQERLRVTAKANGIRPDWSAIRARRREGEETSGNSDPFSLRIPGQDARRNRPYGLGDNDEPGQEN
jgi:hypothetical protein